ncbi:MAG: hypothetical protein HYR66_04210 [Sphingobacteriales bacterium]|nr:hypothetical protein [Sphingobacteriales bacterium]MBI3717963.1 hypothetical protein [Sphingobacteriales bacterium]
MQPKFLVRIMVCFLASAITAQLYVNEQNNLRFKIKPKVPIQAYAFNLREVNLLNGSSFKKTMDKDAGYLLCSS